MCWRRRVGHVRVGRRYTTVSFFKKILCAPENVLPGDYAPGQYSAESCRVERDLEFRRRDHPVESAPAAELLESIFDEVAEGEPDASRDRLLEMVAGVYNALRGTDLDGPAVASALESSPENKL